MRQPRRPRTLSREEAHLWGEVAKLITPLRARATLRKTKAPATDAPAPVPPGKVPPGKVSAGKTLAGKTLAGKTLAGKTPGDGPMGKPMPATPVPTMPVPTMPVLAMPVPAMPAAAGPKPAGPAPAKKPKRVIKLGPAASMPAPVAFTPAPAAPGLERRERQRLSRGLLAIEGRIDLHGLYQAEAHAALVGFLLRARAAGHARVLVVTGKGGEDAYAERGVLRRSVPHWLRGAELRPIVLGFEEAARHHGGTGALYVRLRRR